MNHTNFIKRSSALFAALLLTIVSCISVNAASIGSNISVIRRGGFIFDGNATYLDTVSRSDAVFAYYCRSIDGGITYVNGKEVMIDAATKVSQLNDMCDSDFPNATRLYTATPEFNCHSYAWYSQSTSTNEFWMDNPSAYYSDGYMQVTTPRAGDIICYIDRYGTNQHSGIIKEVLSTSGSSLPGKQYIVESKWGGGGLYRHNGYECPYTTYNSDYVTDEVATGVKFYRYTGHTHTYKTYTSFDHIYYHKSECSCGYTVFEPHIWRQERSSSILGGDSINYVPYSRCIDCDQRELSSTLH